GPAPIPGSGRRRVPRRSREPVGGRPWLVSERARDTGQLAQLITWGHVVALLPESVRAHLPRNLVCVPVPDAPTTTLMLAWPAGSRSPALAAFVHAAITVARRPIPGPQPNPALDLGLPSQGRAP